MNIIDVKVNNIMESIWASGLPKNPHKDPSVDSNDYDRAIKLGKARAGSGHDCFLKGITVYLLIEAPEYWFKQFDRYSFQHVISSTSTMHSILNVDLEKALPSDIYPGTMEELKKDIEKYREAKDEDTWERIIKNIPMGFRYTRAITSNYLQLKTIYQQRKNHKLEEWKTFCKMLEHLEGFIEMAIGKE